MCTRYHHLFQILQGADSTRSLHLDNTLATFSEQLHIIHRCPSWPKAGGGFDVVQACIHRQLAKFSFFLLAEIASFQNDFYQHSVSCSAHCRHFSTNELIISAFDRTQIDHVIDFISACSQGSLHGLHLQFPRLKAKRKAGNGAYSDLAGFHNCGSQLNPARCNTDNSEAQGSSLLTKFLNLIASGRRLQQSLVNNTCHFLRIFEINHFAACFFRHVNNIA